MHLLLVLVLLPQTIRGVVVERTTQAPLPGANVIVIGSDPLIGTTTDAEGRFELHGVPLGRHDIQVSFLGFQPRLLRQVLVSAGRETQLTVDLDEAVIMGEGVTVTPDDQPERPLNELALVSARSFSVEETRRYAGGLDDPARMASAFPGVATSAGVQENALVIRGNAPKGVLWRLEGIEIPNPNHFAGLAVAGGGGLTLFSSQLLADSDFFTGAFPAEYGNALAGVFDMRFRTGNDSRREHAVQLGVLGVEAASEGPFRRGGRSTYLFNYRYSTLGLLMPLLPTEDIATYQDLSFKLSLPTARLGRFDVWGIGGLDAQRGTASRDSAAWEFEVWDRLASDLDLATGAAGVSHVMLLGTRGYLSTTLGATINQTALDQDRIGDDLMLRDDLSLRTTDARLVAGSSANWKLAPSHTNRTGVTLQRLGYDLAVSGTSGSIAQGDGASTLLQLYTQSRWSPGGITLTAGLHWQRLALTGAASLEPRMGVRWDLRRAGTLSAGYGLHSRMEELRVYFLAGGANRDLDLAKAHHLVLAYERPLGAHSHLRAEVYAQRLFDVPVIADSSFSMLNFEQDLTFDAALVSEGLGRNEGVELTLERFLRGGYYHLVTASLFRSRYRGGDGVWRRGRFDRGFTLTALAGKEWTVSGDDLLGVNLRVGAAGGKRRSPVDAVASAWDEEVVRNELRAFTEREPARAVVDVTVTWRRNHSRVSEVWALQVKNALAAQEVSQDYSFLTERVEEVREGFPLPVLSWKLEF